MLYWKNTSFLLENYYSYEGADPPIHLCTMTMTMNIDLHDVNIPQPIEMKKKKQAEQFSSGIR